MRFIFQVFLILFLGSSSWAQTNLPGIAIQADSMERNSETNTIDLNGNVQIIFKNQHLSANQAVIFLNRKEFSAIGDVTFITPKGTIGGEKVYMNYDTNVGTIYRGYVQSGQVFFEGEVIEKTGEDTYDASISEYTACTTCPPAWSFYGSHIKAELEGYAFIQNALLKFGDVPVFWLPYLIVPLKSQRQTGLLTPSIDYSSKGGLAIAQPFFWAIARNQDATLTLKNYERRGLKTMLNYRFIPNAQSFGELDATSLTDRYFSREKRLSNFRDPNSEDLRRWNIKYKNYLVLPDDWVQRTTLNNSSDLQYTVDFPLETNNLGDPAMENRLSLSKSFGSNFFSIDSIYYVNLLQSNPLASNESSVHQLPEIQFLSNEEKIGNGFIFNYDLKYSNFARNDIGYDDLVEGTDGSGTFVRHIKNTCTGIAPNWESDPDCKVNRDGIFNPGTDLIRTGQRLIIQPSLSRPTHLGPVIDLLPKISYQEARYSFGVSDDPNITRRFFRTEVSMKTTLSRIYSTDSQGTDLMANKYKHEIQPEIIATSIPWLEQPNHPFFGFNQSSDIAFFTRETISDQDIYGSNGLQFDYDDRLYDRNLITYRLNNKLMQKKWIGGVPTYRQVATFLISQTYDSYIAASKGESQAWSDIESVLDVRTENFDTYSKLNYFPKNRITNASSRITVSDTHGNYAQLGLTRKYIFSENQTVDFSTRTEDYEIQGGTTQRYVNLVGRLVYDANDTTAVARSSRIKSWSYALILKPPGDCWSIYFTQNREVGGDTQYALNFDFLFDGKNSTRLDSSALDVYNF